MKIVIYISSFFVCLTMFAQSNKMERIKVEGNEFVNLAGKVMVFRGINTSDPDKLATDGIWGEEYIQEISKWGATAVRFPVHPSAWRRRGQEAYLKLLDQGIAWAAKYNMYVIIDWHSIGNLKNQLYLDEMYNTTLPETYAFWKLMAEKYGKNPTVAFYELFNEPTMYQQRFGTITWEEWKKINEEIITIVRANGGEGIPLVAGFNWAYDLTPVKENPIEAEGIGYVAHPYPMKREQPWEPKWTADWGFVKDTYPVVLTEIGFCDETAPGAHVPVIGDETYGDAITNYCDDKNISYFIWVFDKQWSPQMYVDDKYTPSRQGKYFKKKMRSYKK
ncbi:Cellulase (glycosyl hydrolase family 5) [Pustulibacterium marinum]|uniref:Cellulase (Glycosyl hydrolase family 5) n=1 Tax=Pustulibacterium marinum TaxID=1224947 RepID=A0A1I7GGC5_9FLAO|nr:cellulase family glycosylhydrolase [Pustulibacterium marinum]SFU47371.1 Cellulase (glycosyl hydrolase family 5) [Pustulibacterium marinum]